MKGNENPWVSLLVLNNTLNFFVILKKNNFIFLPFFVVNLERFFMKRFKILTVPVNQNIPVVKYTVFFRKSRSNHHISFKYLNIYFWFHIAVTNSWPCWSVKGLSTKKLKFGKGISENDSDKCVYFDSNYWLVQKRNLFFLSQHATI